jgi:hypothetical protein
VLLFSAAAICCNLKTHVQNAYWHKCFVHNIYLSVWKVNGFKKSWSSIRLNFKLGRFKNSSWIKSYDRLGKNSFFSFFLSFWPSLLYFYFWSVKVAKLQLCYSSWVLWKSCVIRFWFKITWIAYWCPKVAPHGLSEMAGSCKIRINDLNITSDIKICTTCFEYCML